MTISESIRGAVGSVGGVDSTRRRHAPALLVALLIVALPFLVPNAYWTGIGTLVLIFWILVSGLNLVVGYAGQLSVGHVGLLAVGAYAACSVSANLGLDAFGSLVFAALAGAVAGLLIGLPSLRLRRFYFAMATLGFATIVSQLAIVWSDVTGGGTGIVAPVFPGPLDTPGGFYWMTLLIAALATYLTWRYGRSNSGRALIAIRDAEVAAESLGVRVFRHKLVVFTFSGSLAGVAGALYASNQTYITPEAFNFDLSMLFFTCVLLGGQGRIFAPFAATVVLVVLPEIAAPLAAKSAFLYAVLLLLVVLLLPKGVGGLVDQLVERRRRQPSVEIAEPGELSTVWSDATTVPQPTLRISGAVKSFGQVRALDGVDLELRPGTVHGLIGPNGSGKTTILNALSGYYTLDEGSVWLGDRELTQMNTQERVRLGLARCFQTPRLPEALTAAQNVMLGGYRRAETGALASFTGLGDIRAKERVIHDEAYAILRVIGFEDLAESPTERIQHSQLRFLEIARCLVDRPACLLLDEPAAGLSHEEIGKLGRLIAQIAGAGIGVLLVEHHADLVFDVCDEVTVLDIGSVLAHGDPDTVREDEAVIHAYLGA